MASCSRPACSGPIAGSLLLHRLDRIAELLPPGDPIGERYGSGLCADHLQRVKAPKGWQIIDRRASTSVSGSVPSEVDPPPAPVPPPSRPRVHGAPGSPSNPQRPVWLPARDGDGGDVSVLRSASSPLLSRAFRGEITDQEQVEGQQRLSM